MQSLNELLSLHVPTTGLWGWAPVAASLQAQRWDTLFTFLLFTCTGLFALVVLPMVVFVARYRRRRPGQRATSQTDHNTWMELAWTALPLLYLGAVFTWGFYQFLDLRVAPSPAKQLRVIAQKWQWTAVYEDEGFEVGGQGATFGVVVGQPVKVVLSSQDVIHSFFIPNLRVKQDTVPGRYTTLWFTPTLTGEFPILCAEYCGRQHSLMVAKLKVMAQEDYDKWADGVRQADQSLSPTQLGEKLYAKKGCVACHTVDGSPKIGPSFKGLYGSTAELEGGGGALVDDDYIRQSILEPQKRITKGYPPVMPSYQGQVSEKEIAALIAYIKSLGNTKPRVNSDSRGLK
ncbi:MAG: cytochrome c oxidase subunit II [Myxococcota bacterium]